MNQLHIALDKANISKKIAVHLAGNKHNHWHHKAIGSAIMFFGTLLVHATGNYSFPIAVLGELIGNSFHGIGLIPFTYGVEQTAKELTKQ